MAAKVFKVSKKPPIHSFNRDIESGYRKGKGHKRSRGRRK